MKFNLFSEPSRCRLHLSPNVHFCHPPKAGSQLPRSLIAPQAFSSKDGDVDQRNDMPSSIPAPSFSQSLVTTPPLEEDWFSPFKTLKYWTKNVSSKTRGKLNERNINRLNDYIVTMYYYIIR